MRKKLQNSINSLQMTRFFRFPTTFHSAYSCCRRTRFSFISFFLQFLRSFCASAGVCCPKFLRSPRQTFDMITHMRTHSLPARLPSYSRTAFIPPYSCTTHMVAHCSICTLYILVYIYSCMQYMCHMLFGRSPIVILFVTFVALDVAWLGSCKPH